MVFRRYKNHLFDAYAIFVVFDSISISIQLPTRLADLAIDFWILLRVKVGKHGKISWIQLDLSVHASTQVHAHFYAMVKNICVRYLRL